VFFFVINYPVVLSVKIIVQKLNKDPKPKQTVRILSYATFPIYHTNIIFIVRFLQFSFFWNLNAAAINAVSMLTFYL
jgi:hypothetical protein